MNLELHIRVVGALQIALAAAHAPFPRWFNWKEELGRLSLLNRQIFLVHGLFIVLMLLMFGALSAFGAPAMLAPGSLGQMVCAGLGAFWLARLYCQFFVYSPELWKGHGGRTAIHVGVSMMWIYFAGTYLWAAIVADNGR